MKIKKITAKALKKIARKDAKAASCAILYQPKVPNALKQED